jgi:hypothetical protein
VHNELGLEPLGCALGFGWRTTYSHAERLAGAGFVERVYDRGGSVVAITRSGLRAVDAGQGDVRTGATNGFGLAHSRAMSWWPPTSRSAVAAGLASVS